MATDDKNSRRIHARSAFNNCDFECVDKKVKADKFQRGPDCSVYFYWGQGNDLDLSIHPGIKSLNLLKIDGVSIKETLLAKGGLRPGTAITEFPRTFGEFTPKDPKSHVGRMFSVQEFALPAFLRALPSSIDLAERSLRIEGISAGPSSSASSTPGEEPDPSASSSDLVTSYPTSQGYESDPVIRRAIEKYAVARATNHYSKKGYKVKELGKPFDLLCVRNDHVIHVEVKGSRSMLNAVILTVNEVKDARVQSWQSDLFIVEGICIDLGSDSKPIAGLGSARVLQKWEPKESDLSPSRFSYSLPVLSEWVPIPF